MEKGVLEMGFTEILTIVFIVLKLIGEINWSWWLVLLPEIIAAVFYIAVVVFQVISVMGLKKEIKRFDDDMRKW